MSPAKKKKIVRIGIFFFFSLAVVLILLHTGPVRIQILRFLESSLEKKQGLKLKAHSLRYNLLSLRFHLANVSLSGIGKEEMPVFFEAERISVRFSLGSFLKKGIRLSSLKVRHPRLNYFIDKSGSRNTPFARKPGRPRAETNMPDFRLKRADVEDAHIRYVDETGQMGGELPGVEMEVRWVGEKRHSFQFRTRKGGYVFYKGVGFDLNEFLAMGHFDESHADFERIEVNVSGSRFIFSGGLSDFTHTAVSGNLKGILDLEDIRRIFPEMGSLSGKLNLEGKVNGPLAKPTAQLSLKGTIHSFKGIKDIDLAAEAGWKDNRLSVFPFKLSSPEGLLEGTADLSPLDWKQGNRIELEWSSLDLGSLDFISESLTLFSSRTSGILQASWSDLSLETVEGRAEISVFPQEKVKPSPQQIPLSGLFQGEIRAEKIFLAVEELHLPGVWGQARLQIDQDSLMGEWRAESREMEAMLPSLTLLFGNVDQKILSLLKFDGNLRIKGDLGGSIRSPVVHSEFFGENISWKGLSDLSIFGKLDFSPSAIKVDSTLDLPDEGQVKLSGSYPLSPAEELNLRISGERLGLEKIKSLSVKEIPAEGSISFSASVFGYPEEPQVKADISADEFVLYGQRFDTVNLSLSLKDKKIALESLVASKSEGFFEAGGWIDLPAEEFSVQFSFETLKIDGWRLPGDSSDIKMVIDLSGKSQGKLQAPELLAEGVLSGFSLGDLELGNLKVRAGMRERKIDFEVDAPFFRSRWFGTLLAEPPFRLEATVDIDDLPLQRLSDIYPVSLAKNLAGVFGAQLEMVADLAHPADTWNVRAKINRILLHSGLFSIQNVRPIAFVADSNTLNVEDFQLSGSGLNIEGRGSLSWTDGGRSNASVRAEADLSVLSDLFQDVAAEGLLKIDSRLLGGPFLDSRFSAGLTLSAGRFEHSGFPGVFNNIGIRLDVQNNQVDIRSCIFELGETVFSLEGRLPFQSLPFSLPMLSPGQEEEQLDLRIGLKNLNSSLLNSFFRGDAAQSVEGKMDADIVIRGSKLHLPQLSASMKTESFILNMADLRLEQDKPMEVHLDQGRVIVSPFSMSGPNGRLTIGGSLDLTEDKDLNFVLEGELDFGTLQEFMKDIQSRGTCGFDFRITGNPSVPLINGVMNIRNAGLTLAPPRFFLEDFSGRIQFEDNRLFFKEWRGLLNGGKVEIGGGIVLEGWSLSEGEIVLGAEDVMFDISRNLQSQISGDLRLNFSEDGKILSGTVFINHGQYSEDINLESSFFRDLRRGAASTPVTRGSGQWLESLRLQVAVTTGNPFVFGNSLLRSQISAAVNLTGTFQQPGLTGRLECLEGGKLYFGKNTFLIRQATVDFINPRRIEPDLNVTAVTKVGEFGITLTLTGTPDELSASLTSDPPLTEPNIVSLLVTGVTLEGTASSLLNATGSEALSYLDSVLTGRLESALEKSLGLDSVRIDAGLISSIDNPGARITLQQHLSRNLELIFSQNLQTARNRLWVLDYNPFPNVNVQGVKEDNNELNLFFRHEVRFGLKSTEETREKRIWKIVDRLVLEGSPAFPERKIRNRLQLRPGGRYDDFKLYDGLDRLRGMYARHFFLNPTFIPIRKEEDGKMRISLQIYSGPKIVLEFSGDPVPGTVEKAASRLWMRTPFDRLAIASIEELLQRRFINKGHYQVTVSHLESTGEEGEKRVDFKIVRGLKYKKPKLFFEGNHSFASGQLEEAVRNSPDFHLLFIDSRASLHWLRDYYIRNGFLRVRLEEPRIKYFPQERKLTATFPIREGPRYKIGNLVFEGNDYFDSVVLNEHMNIRKGDVYRHDDVEKAVFALQEAYAREGFNQVELDVLTREDEKNEAVDLSVKIQENLQERVEEVRIAGNSITSENVIRRELEIQTGDLVDHRLLNKARKRLYDLGIFKRVQIETVPLESASPLLGPFRIKINVEELQPFRLRYGLQYDTETSAGVSTELVNRNLFGRAMLAGASFRLNREERDIKAFYRSPYFISKKISTEFFVFSNSSDKPSFSLDRSGLTVQQQTKLGQFFILSCSYSYEQVRTVMKDPLSGARAADSVHHEGMVNLAVSRDTRDNIMNASRGLFLSQNIGYAAGWLGSEVNFLRYFGELYSYRKISGSFIYAFAFRLGLGQGLGREFSLSQRFFAGGGTTIRGFKKNEVGPKNPLTGLAEGGDAVMIMNHELRFSFAPKWSAAVFLDMGNVYGRLSDFKPFDLREAAGFGIRYHTRLILVRVDWGFKLDRRPGESLSRIFFSIGQVF